MSSTALPRTVHLLWFQGRDAAPEVVKHNLARWERLNPGYKVKVWDEEGVGSLLVGSGLATEGLSRQSLSDIFRARLLVDHGGVWADATVFPVEPLDDWLPQAVETTGFFAFEREDVPLSSWLIASAPGHHLASRWWEEVCRVWSVPRQVSPVVQLPQDPARRVAPETIDEDQELPYFWLHCLFAYVLRSDPIAAQAWEGRHHLSAMPAHRLQDLCRAQKSPSERQVAMALAASPVQKLDWRETYPLEKIERVLNGTPQPTWLERIADALRR